MRMINWLFVVSVALFISGIGFIITSARTSANLLLIGNRPVDQDDWVKLSKAMADAGHIALKAADAKSAEGILAAGETINQTCDNCHQKYQR